MWLVTRSCMVLIVWHRYNIEPFFFSSSFNWIPARYQESVGEGDREFPERLNTEDFNPISVPDITLTLTFIRAMQSQVPSSVSGANPGIPTLQSAEQIIDTQAPLGLSSSTSRSLNLLYAGYHSQYFQVVISSSPIF